MIKYENKAIMNLLDFYSNRIKIHINGMAK